jgi:hypothetical protein
MTPAEAFEITPEERARLDVPPFRDTPEDVQRALAGAVHEQLVKAYADGEITLERALEVIWSCVIGCRLTDRITLLALTARRALENPPAERKGHRQLNPTWVRYSAARLVQVFRDRRPGERFAPNDLNNYSTPILRDAIEWLVTLRLCEPITARTLYDWYREAQDEGILEPATEVHPNSTSTA